VLAMIFCTAMTSSGYVVELALAHRPLAVTSSSVCGWAVSGAYFHISKAGAPVMGQVIAR
jgi:hypothetical protein